MEKKTKIDVINIDPRPNEYRNKKTKKDLNDFLSNTNLNNFVDDESNVVDVPVEKKTSIDNIINIDPRPIEYRNKKTKKDLNDFLSNTNLHNFIDDESNQDEISEQHVDFKKGDFVINIDDVKKSSASLTSPTTLNFLWRFRTDKLLQRYDASGEDEYGNAFYRPSNLHLGYIPSKNYKSIEVITFVKNNSETVVKLVEKNNVVNLKSLSNWGQKDLEKDDGIADEIFENNDKEQISKQFHETVMEHELPAPIVTKRNVVEDTMELEIEESDGDFESLTKSSPLNFKSYTNCTKRRPKSPKTYLRTRRHTLQKVDIALESTKNHVALGTHDDVFVNEYDYTSEASNGFEKLDNKR